MSNAKEVRAGNPEETTTEQHTYFTENNSLRGDMMKKSFLVLLTIAALALFAVSCKKQETTSETDTSMTTSTSSTDTGMTGTSSTMSTDTSGTTSTMSTDTGATGMTGMTGMSGTT
ncbi:MAG: hypothetical protein ACREMY_30050, partial [bacterium]